MYRCNWETCCESTKFLKILFMKKNLIAWLHGFDNWQKIQSCRYVEKFCIKYFLETFSIWTCFCLLEIKHSMLMELNWQSLSIIKEPENDTKSFELHFCVIIALLVILIVYTTASSMIVLANIMSLTQLQTNV